MASNLDEIEICQNVEPHEEENPIKSKAVVKLTNVQVPAKFTRLQCNTDLNMPPTNWSSNSANTYGLRHAMYKSGGFTSFRMANRFSECLGEVDVVSDAENIKNLLKLPYSPQSAVSMMVHRIENTLLIDEFDLQKYLLHQADDDWKWLRTFISEHILSRLSEKDKNYYLRDKSQGALQTNNLLSKFLHHSLEESKDTLPETTEACSSLQEETSKNVSETPSLRITGPLLPEPNHEENIPDPQSNHTFSRNIIWTFEDIRMLIGTDMPIFGGGTRPCISLRLRDMAKPINVLTGIDYWLDNLMCNVPEVVMCYHLDGLVQKYELIKTEDLPYLENSKFSPQLIRNVAQNILSFLKSNATKAGHTYWLFKGKNDDVVKLYDLTTLCRSEDCTAKNENPFTVPVAMLLYTVARNIKNSSKKISPRDAGSIKTLLDNCIKLLPKEKYAKIVTSSHYILSDLHVPAGIDPKDPKFNNCTSDNKSVCDEDLENLSDSETFDAGDEADSLVDSFSSNVAVKNICDTLNEFKLESNWKKNRTPAPLTGSVEERCRDALQHIYYGIDCLKYFASSEQNLSKEKQESDRTEERERIIQEEQNPNMAKPFQPIPLPYESLKFETKMTNPFVPIATGWENVISKDSQKTNKKTKRKKNRTGKKSQISDENAQKNLIAFENSKEVKSWNDHLKLLLVEKASLCYATLSEHNYALEKYGTCLQQICLGIKCLRIVEGYMASASAQRNCLIGRAGDCFFQFAINFQQIDVYREQFRNYDEIDHKILNELKDEIIGYDLNFEFTELTGNVEELMNKSCHCYETALESATDKSKHELIRRLGNVRNELGAKYMYWAQEEYAKYLADQEKIENEENNLNEGQDEQSEIAEKSKEDEKKKVQISEEPLYTTLSKLSYSNLTRGISAFEKVGDSQNLAFLLCNMGRFMRFRAHVTMPEEEPHNITTQKKFYNQAFEYYQRAHGILGSRKNHTELWDVINWEYSTATFNLAKQVQDYNEASEIFENDIVELLQKSLKLCDVEHDSARQILYKFRSGLIHHRLASLYHNILRRTDDDKWKKSTLQLCQRHYEKASIILEDLKESKNYLEVQLERIGLQEFLAEGSNVNRKFKNIQTALELCMQTKSIFQNLAEVGLENSTSDDITKLLKLYENRIQFNLRTLVKLSLTKSTGKELNKLTDRYKMMYSAALCTKEVNDIKMYATQLTDMLEKFEQINETVKIS